MFLGASDGNGNAIFAGPGPTGGDFTNFFLLMVKFRESDYAMEWQKDYWEAPSDGDVVVVLKKFEESFSLTWAKQIFLSPISTSTMM